MNVAVPREGPCAPLLIFVAGLALSATVGAAQTVDVSELQACAALETAAARLACYEALTPAIPEAAAAASAAAGTMPSAAGPSAPGAVAPLDTPSAASNSDPQILPAGPVAAPASMTAKEESFEPAAAGNRTMPADAGAVAPEPESPPAPDREPAAAAPAPAAPTPVPKRLGAEQLDGSIDAGDVPTTATVTRVTRDYRDRLEFHLENGHVWRQIEPRRFRYPRGQAFDVVITQGMMGEYRLRVGGEGPMVRIRRVE